MRRQFLSGALFGLACLFKLVALLDFAGFMVFMVLARTRLIRDDLEDEKVEALWPFVAGFLVPSLAVSFSLILRGTFGNFMTATILDMFHYMGYSGDPWLGLVLWPMAGTATLLLLILGTVLIGMNFASGKIHEREMFVGVLFWFEYIAVLLSGRHYNHYLIQLVPGASLLIVMGIQRAARSPSVTSQMNAGTGLICALYLALIIFSHGQPIGAPYGGPEVHHKPVASTVATYYVNYVTHILGTRSEATYQRFFNDEQSRIDLLGKTLRSAFRDVPRDAIYLYTNQVWSYVHLGLRVPTPFTAAYHRNLAENGTARLIESLEANPPQLIVLDQAVAVFPELARVITRSYRPVANDAVYHYFVKAKSPVQSDGLRGGSPAGDVPRDGGLISAL